MECKLEELAAAITSSVLGRLDTGVWEALTGQQQEQQQQSGGRVPFVAPRDAAALEDDQRPTEKAETEAIAEAVAPLRSRIAALEEQMSQLMAAAPVGRSGSSSSSGGGGGGDTHKGGRGCSGCVSRGAGLGRAEEGGNAPEAEPLFALNALAQRTGTLEGRHKQVQAKVALLDNAFGPKASDWAQTIKAFLQEREAAKRAAVAHGGAGRAVVTHSAPGGGGGKGKRRLAVDAPVFSPRAARTGCGNGGAGGGTAAASTAPSSVPLIVVAGTKHDNNAPEIVGATQRDNTVANTTTSATTSTAKAGVEWRERVVDRCAACAETQERCSRLERRVEDSEEAVALLQSKVASTAAAAAAAADDAAKAWEAAENSRRDAAAEKPACLSSG